MISFTAALILIVFYVSKNYYYYYFFSCLLCHWGIENCFCQTTSGQEYFYDLIFVLWEEAMIDTRKPNQKRKNTNPQWSLFSSNVFERHPQSSHPSTSTIMLVVKKPNLHKLKMSSNIFLYKSIDSFKSPWKLENHSATNENKLL